MSNCGADHLQTSDADTCLVLEDHSAATTLISKKNSPPLSPVVSGSGETPCSAEEASEKCLTEESPVNQCLSPAQVPKNGLFVVFLQSLVSIHNKV